MHATPHHERLDSVCIGLHTLLDVRQARLIRHTSRVLHRRASEGDAVWRTHHKPSRVFKRSFPHLRFMN